MNLFIYDKIKLHVHYIVLIDVTKPKSLLELSIFTAVEFSFPISISICCRSQWPRGLRRRSSAAHLLRLWVRIPPEGMDIFLL